MKKALASTPVSTNTMEEVDTEPLSGRPYFNVHIYKSHIDSPYQLTVGSNLTPLLPCRNTPVTLTRGTRKWKATYVGTYKSFDFLSWKAFAADNALKIGDICLFELHSCTDTHIHFKVQVLRGDFPSILLQQQNGSAENPVVID